MTAFCVCVALALARVASAGPVASDLRHGYPSDAVPVPGYGAGLAGVTHESYVATSPAAANVASAPGVTKVASNRDALSSVNIHAAPGVETSPTAPRVYTNYQSSPLEPRAPDVPFVPIHAAAPQFINYIQPAQFDAAVPALSAVQSPTGVTNASIINEAAPGVSRVYTYPSLAAYAADPALAAHHGGSSGAAVQSSSTVSNDSTAYHGAPGATFVQYSRDEATYPIPGDVNGFRTGPAATHVPATYQAAPAVSYTYPAPEYAAYNTAPAAAYNTAPTAASVYAYPAATNGSATGQHASNVSAAHAASLTDTSAAVSGVTTAQPALAGTKVNATYQPSLAVPTIHAPPAAVPAYFPNPIEARVYQPASQVGVSPFAASLQAFPGAATYQAPPAFAPVAQAPGLAYGFGARPLPPSAGNYGYGYGLDSYGLNYDYGLGDYAILLRKKK